MTRLLKIAIVTQYYAPDLPSWTPTGLARELAARGHSVRVLTTFPHYRTGRVSDGYRQTWRHFEMDGPIVVRRVPIIPSHSTNAIGRIANYLSFTATTRMARSFARGADVAYVYATPMTVAEAPRVWAKSLKVPYVLHMQDLWPESMTGSGFLPGWMNRIAEAALRPWLRGVYARASATIAIAPTMKSILIERGVAPEKLHVILNWSNDFDASADGDEVRRGGDAMRVIYAGNLGQLQDLETVVAAAASVRDLPEVKVQIAGSGVLAGRLEALASTLGADNVEFLGQLSTQDIAALYGTADFQLVTLRNLPAFRGIIPSKLTSGLASGVPVITTVSGDVTEIVERAELGITAESESVESLAAALRRAAATTPDQRAQYAARARAYYREHMSKGHAIDRIEALLVSVSERTFQ